MSHQQTTLRHVWLAGLGVMSRLRQTMDRITGRTRVEPEEPPVFVTTHKPAKRVTAHSASRRAGERESQRRIAGRGR